MLGRVREEREAHQQRWELPPNSRRSSRSLQWRLLHRSRPSRDSWASTMKLRNSFDLETEAVDLWQDLNLKRLKSLLFSQLLLLFSPKRKSLKFKDQDQGKHLLRLNQDYLKSNVISSSSLFLYKARAMLQTPRGQVGIPSQIILSPTPRSPPQGSA